MDSRKRAVSIGGGTGQPNTIKALRSLGYHVSSIVAMADDGGSTGVIRRETGQLPPGDIRKCLVAMATDDEDPLVKAFASRVDYADDHALGNLLLAELDRITGSLPEAVSICERILDCDGDVLPSTLEDVILCGETRDGFVFHGQAQLGHGTTAMDHVWLEPAAPKPYGPTIEALAKADLIVIGPGSLFTSIIPNLLVDGVVDAIKNSKATTVFVCPLADMQGETWGLTAEEHLEALLECGLEGAIDVALFNKMGPRGSAMMTTNFEALTQEQIDKDAQRLEYEAALSPKDIKDPGETFRCVEISKESISRMSKSVHTCIVRDFSDSEKPVHHNIAKLAAVLKGVSL